MAKMATFNKFRDVAAYTLSCKPQGNYVVGDVVAYDISDSTLTIITKGETVAATLANIETAVAAGKEIYIIAQGDNVTGNLPTAYKNYNVSDAVAQSTSAAKDVTCYLVENVSDITIDPVAGVSA